MLNRIWIRILIADMATKRLYLFNFVKSYTSVWRTRINPWNIALVQFTNFNNLLGVSLSLILILIFSSLRKVIGIITLFFRYAHSFSWQLQLFFSHVAWISLWTLTIKINITLNLCNLCKWLPIKHNLWWFRHGLYITLIN